ncbi:hypothetical protein H3Z83_02280 [Tenacibaculum sp. S7007]|uniref:Uncharacterized protein n=1 Tax=Tenacibaculum pelagium TaxID=2759527 RepID=A0A839ALR9_9FLAO|nr:hypothetical protein [Tenacibaculum pelagium]MBA6155356.1 hypothetical protein [Tenacibaculum pelagium]
MIIKLIPTTPLMKFSEGNELVNKMQYPKKSGIDNNNIPKRSVPNKIKKTPNIFFIIW